MSVEKKFYKVLTGENEYSKAIGYAYDVVVSKKKVIVDIDSETGVQTPRVIYDDPVTMYKEYVPKDGEQITEEEYNTLSDQNRPKHRQELKTLAALEKAE